MRFLRKLLGKHGKDDDMPPHVRRLQHLIEAMRPEMRAEFPVRITPLNRRVDTIPGAEGRFGFDETNPIPVCWVAGEVLYLASLRCECGECFFFHRLGSVGEGPDGHVVDHFELLCKRREHRFTLYMDMYHAGFSSLVPDGLGMGPPEGIGISWGMLDADFPDSLLRRALHDTRDDQQSSPAASVRPGAGSRPD